MIRRGERGPSYQKEAASAAGRSATKASTRAWIGLASLGALALLAVPAVGDALFAHESATLDWDVQRWILAHRQPRLVTVFFVITTLGGITGMRVLAVLGALDLWRRGQRRGAACVLGATVAAFGLFTLLKRLYARGRPPVLDGSMADDYSFPSGHATMSAAVCCTLAYLYWRLGLVRGRPAIVLMILLPLAVGISRIYLDVHWATDVFGGWTVGLLVALLAAALCDPEPRSPAPLLDR